MKIGFFAAFFLQNILVSHIHTNNVAFNFFSLKAVYFSSGTRNVIRKSQQTFHQQNS